MTVPTPAAERARRSLEGLNLGDCFGETFFWPTATTESRIRDRVLADAPWRYTDDSAQAAVLTKHLLDRGEVDLDTLAAAFAAEYVRDPSRGYGPSAHDRLAAVAGGADWEAESMAPFGGTGSMGNGAAMRVAPLGAFFADEPDRIPGEARRSALVTHFNPEGVAGAVAVAVAAGCFARGERDAVWDAVLAAVEPGLTRGALEAAARTPLDAPVRETAVALGSGFRVCSHDTVPFTLWCALRCPDDFEEALWATAWGLGDIDTTCAIVGGILASQEGCERPKAWIERAETAP